MWIADPIDVLIIHHYGHLQHDSPDPAAHAERQGPKRRWIKTALPSCVLLLGLISAETSMSGQQDVIELTLSQPKRVAIQDHLLVQNATHVNLGADGTQIYFIDARSGTLGVFASCLESFEERDLRRESRERVSQIVDLVKIDEETFGLITMFGSIVYMNLFGDLSYPNTYPFREHSLAQRASGMLRFRSGEGAAVFTPGRIQFADGFFYLVRQPMSGDRLFLSRYSSEGAWEMDYHDTARHNQYHKDHLVADDRDHYWLNQRAWCATPDGMMWLIPERTGALNQGAYTIHVLDWDGNRVKEISRPYTSRKRTEHDKRIALYDAVGAAWNRPDILDRIEINIDPYEPDVHELIVMHRKGQVWAHTSRSDQAGVGRIYDVFDLYMREFVGQARVDYEDYSPKDHHYLDGDVLMVVKGQHDTNYRGLFVGECEDELQLAVGLLAAEGRP